MITISMTLFPGGLGLLREGIVEGTIWTTDDGKFHAYHLENGDNIFDGKVLKEFSGHRNPFKLLEKIAQDIEKGLDK